MAEKRGALLTGRLSGTPGCGMRRRATFGLFGRSGKFKMGEKSRAHSSGWPPWYPSHSPLVSKRLLNATSSTPSTLSRRLAWRRALTLSSQPIWSSGAFYWLVWGMVASPFRDGKAIFSQSCSFHFVVDVGALPMGPKRDGGTAMACHPHLPIQTMGEHSVLKPRLPNRKPCHLRIDTPRRLRPFAKHSRR